MLISALIPAVRPQKFVLMDEDENILDSFMHQMKVIR